MPILQRDDPAVEQFGRLDPLAAKVVDQQAAAIALQLQRGFAHVAVRVVAELQAVHCHFAADDHGRAADFDPAAVVIGPPHQALRVVSCRLVIGRVEEFDELPVFDQGLGHPDILAEATRDPPGEG